MKKLFLLFSLTFIAFMIAGCFGAPEFEGIKYRVTRDDNLFSKHFIQKTITMADANYTSPEEVNIGFAKVFFPTKEDFITMFNLTPDASDTHPVDDISPYLDEAIIGVNTDLNNPMIMSLENTELTSLDTFQMELYKEYFGAVVQIVYYEFKMYDFSIRFYANNSGIYQAHDILIKRDTDPSWKFAYQRVTRDTSEAEWNIAYNVELFTQRQTDLFYETWDAGVIPEDGDLMHLAMIREEDLENDYAGSFESRPILLAYGLTSADQIDENGGGFGRIYEDIIGITLEIVYTFSNQYTCGLQHSFPVSQNGRVTWADLSQTDNSAIKVYPINSVEHRVTYTDDTQQE